MLTACLGGRLRAAILWGAALSAVALAAGAAAVLPWSAAPQELTLELNEPTIFYSLPPFITELKHGKARGHDLRLAVAIEIPASQQWRLEEQQSVIEAAIKARVVHFERWELEGRAGADRVRDEVLASVNDAISPAMASKVLYLQFLID